MGVIIGIDIGGTNTKIVGLRDGKVFSPVHVRATDPVSSLYGAFGKFTTNNDIGLSDIEKVMITGVGSSFIKDDIFGVETVKVDEFVACGLGGLFLSGLSKAVIISMGTGTAFIAADGGEVKHLGGSGVGGGTLTGLSKKLIGISHMEDIVDLAKDGDLKMIDLLISDITAESGPTLLPDITASNFGKVNDLATKADIALGIINAIFQTAGMLAVFAARTTGDTKAVVTGYLATVPQAKDIFASITKLHGTEFIIPDTAEYATAIGAAISYIDKAGTN